MKPRMRTGVLAIMVVALAAGAFLAGRQLGERSPAEADVDGGPITPDLAATPAPGQTPDTSKDFWWIPWQNAEDQKPRYRQTVAGIEIGPDIWPDFPCLPLDHGAPDAAAGSAVEVKPGFLPAGSEAIRSSVGVCGGEVVRHETSWRVPGDEEAMRAVARGEKTFFEVENGALFEITISRTGPSPRFTSSLASERFREARLADGRAVVVADPLFAEGAGEAAVLIYDAKAGTLTTVTGGNMTLAELVKIAENLR